MILDGIIHENTTIKSNDSLSNSLREIPRLIKPPPKPL